MNRDIGESIELTEAQHRLSFFRQSGWMTITTIGSGAFLSLTHVFSKFIPNTEYAAVGTLLQFLNWVAIPAVGMQMVFAQQTSAAITATGKSQLAATLRVVLLGTFCLWLAMLLATFLVRAWLLTTLEIGNPAAFWVTMIIGLFVLWLPVFQGLLQGRQNFFWMGWCSVFNGAGRFFAGAFIIFLFNGWAAGIMVGMLFGVIGSLGLAVWQNRDLWSISAGCFEPRIWLKWVIPLTLGFGARQFLFSADVLVAQAHLGKDGQAAPYVFGGTLARAIVLLTGPIAAVMFPKLVRNAARSQESNLMVITLICTSLLSAFAALGLSLAAPILIKLGSKPQNISILPLMPLLAWSMVPLAIATVLLNHLMAHSCFKSVVALVFVAFGYWMALQHYHHSFREIVQVSGLFNLLFLAVCIYFTRLHMREIQVMRKARTLARTGYE